MGNERQFSWVSQNVHRIEGPILEVGSRYVGEKATFGYRGLLRGRGEYVGTDLSDGEGVDLCADLTVAFADLPAELRERQFKTVICMSVMEHVFDVFSFARNLEALVGGGGLLFLSVPWVWRYHGYPADYWRISPTALEKLFGSLEMIPSESFIHFPHRDAVRPLAVKELSQYAPYKWEGRMKSALARKAKKLGRRALARLAPGLAHRRMVMNPMLINVLYRKPAGER